VRVPPARIAFVLASLGALALAAQSALVAPPSPWVALVALVSYLGFVTLGVTQLRWQVFVDAIVRGPAGARGVALTFDDGPDPEWTPRALDALDAAGAKATFFVIGKKAKKHPEVVKEILRRGHKVGLHSHAHDRLMSFKLASGWRADLERGIRVLEAITGERPRLFRPPIGHTNPSVAPVLRELGLVTVGWSVSARDGIGTAPERVVERIRGAVRDGAIVLLHDAAERGDRTPAGVVALPKVLEAIREKNLEIVPLEAWVPAAERRATTRRPPAS
jgi:peptidoglycan/xylan/chitin deacetylase (PgdA/CDA1 family)